MTIEVKAIVHTTFMWCCLSLLSHALHKVVSLLFHLQMKATEQYFPLVFFIMLYKVVSALESEDGILKCDHSNESY